MNACKTRLALIACAASLISFSVPSSVFAEDPVPFPRPPGTPTPDNPEYPPDITYGFVKPVQDYAGRAGLGAAADNSGIDAQANLSGTVLLGTPQGMLFLEAQATGGQGGAFGSAGGDLKFRKQFSVDVKRVFWWGVGFDIAGQGAANSKFDSFFSVMPTVFFGKIVGVKNHTCEVRAFAKAGVALFDNQNQAENKWGLNLDTLARPMVGAETLTHCDSLRILGDYEHLFDFGSAGATDRLSLQISQAWSVIGENKLRLGFFGKVQGAREGGVEGLDPTDPRTGTRYNGAVLGGIEARFKGPF
jgi:hypothetical protein